MAEDEPVAEPEFDAAAWLKQAGRPGAPPAWNGVDRCTRPKKGRGACQHSGKPHRHCECGVGIDLSHGYCDDCFAALMRGAAMTARQAEAQREKRLSWLERFGFIRFTEDGIKVVRGE